MSPFSNLHPLAIVSYYMGTLVFVIWLGHPFLYLLLFVMMLADYGLAAGLKKTCKTFLCSIGAALVCVVVNPLFNHRGVTVLFLLFDTRITREAVLYGLHMALLLVGSLLLFSCFSSVMTSEKIMTLAAGRFPSFCLLFSMILRIVPKVKKDFLEMTALHGNRPRVWSALTGKWMEDSVERSMAMKNKGYGRGKRTSYFKRPLQMRDMGILTAVCAMAVYVSVMHFFSPVRVQFFPSIRIGVYDPIFFVVWFVYLGIPVWMRGKEELSWLLSRQKNTGSTIRVRQSRQSL